MSTARAATIGAALAVALSPACADAEAFDVGSWTLLLDAPAADAQGTIEYCPALMQPGFDPITGQPTRSTRIAAPTSLTGSLDTPDEGDTWQLSGVAFDGRFGPQALEFDMGPIGNFYESEPPVFEIAAINDGVTPAPSPATVRAERAVVGGSRESKSELTLTLLLTFDCDTITSGDQSCACDDVALSYTANSQGF